MRSTAVTTVIGVIQIKDAEAIVKHKDYIHKQKKAITAI